jgi:hypothetical protein
MKLRSIGIVANFAAWCLFAGVSVAQPVPLVSGAHPVTWWFAFKFNDLMPETLRPVSAGDCPFGGVVNTNNNSDKHSNLAYAYAYGDGQTHGLVAGGSRIGWSDEDPLGVTYRNVFEGSYSYVVFNDQFYGDPQISGCGNDCEAPWAHAKGLLAWDDQGQGLLLQVTTPSWPHSGSARDVNPLGNTLGCINRDNPIKYSQHFFAVRLSKADVVLMLQSLANAGIATVPGVDQVFHIRAQSPADLAQLAGVLGNKDPADPKPMMIKLSSGVGVISKPAALHVPPWQYVSAMLGGEPLRVATWWTGVDKIPDKGAVKPGCWDARLTTPGAVQNALTGTWDHKSIDLKGASGNHAKIGVSQSGGNSYTIFGDMNQTGAYSGNCNPPKGQSVRGGLFYVLSDKTLYDGVSALLSAATAQGNHAAPAHASGR